MNGNEGLYTIQQVRIYLAGKQADQCILLKVGSWTETLCNMIFFLPSDLDNTFYVA